MPNYQNSKIYKIVSPSNPDLVYYGSTTQKLSVRMAEHRRNTTASKEILCFDDAIILLVENYPCFNKEELHKKEGEYILNNNCVNKYVAGRSMKQYREDNKEHIKEYNKKYKEENKEMIKEYREENKDKAKEYREENKDKAKEYHKKYYEDNKDKYKKYYEDNKEILKERRKKYYEEHKK
jgi:hypothetical protein